MKLKTLCQVAAAAGLASATSLVAAQTIPAEVTVPLNSNVPIDNSYYGQGPYHGPGQVVYDHTGGMHMTGYSGEFVPPARFPVERIPVQYLRYYPARWYGLPGSTLPAIAPQVHMPTDTTQLGFYSQRVPTWMPVPGMIPGPPNPAMYHTFVPMAYSSGAYGGGVVTGDAVSEGQIISSRPVNEGTTISNEPSYSTSGTISADTSVAPVPEGTELPLQPPPAPPAE